MRFTNVGVSIDLVVFPTRPVNASSDINRVLAAQWEPYVSVERDDYGKKTLRGLTGHMLDFITNTMGMKYEVIFPNDHLWGTKLPNGSWTGMIGDLARNVSDSKRRPNKPVDMLIDICISIRLL